MYNILEKHISNYDQRLHTQNSHNTSKTTSTKTCKTEWQNQLDPMIEPKLQWKWTSTVGRCWKSSIKSNGYVFLNQQSRWQPFASVDYYCATYTLRRQLRVDQDSSSRITWYANAIRRCSWSFFVDLFLSGGSSHKNLGWNAPTPLRLYSSLTRPCRTV